MAHLHDKIGHDLVEDADGFGEGFSGEGMVGVRIAVGKQKEAYWSPC